MISNLLKIRDILDENYEMSLDLVNLFSELEEPNRVWITFVHHKAFSNIDKDKGISLSQIIADEVLLNFDLTEYISAIENGNTVNMEDKLIQYSQMHAENRDNVICRIQFLDKLLSIKLSKFEKLYDKYFKGMKIDGYVLEDGKIRFNLNRFSEVRGEILDDDILKISEMSLH